MGGGTPRVEPRESFDVNKIGVGRSGLMKPTAYDTAWLARIPAEHDAGGRRWVHRTTGRVPAFPEALDWLRQNQNEDGSWGAEIEYVHDRVISTLVTILALTEWEGSGPSKDGQDRIAIERGLRYIWEKADTDGTIGQLEQEHETIGFEVILPTLLKGCQEFGFTLPWSAFERYDKMRDEKMAKIPPDMLYSRDTTMAFSLEFMGDNLDVDKTGTLQEENGSIGVSPSATAYFLTKLPDNVAARRYVADIASVYGSTAPEVFPFDVFETAWSLWNLGLAGLSLQDPPVASLVANLMRLWERSEARGLGFSSMYSASDADCTAMVYSVLRYAGYEPPSQVFRRFERDCHFVCYPWERDNDASLSVNIHVLHALQGLEQDSTTRIVNFLGSRMNSQGYWQDKWHISPYYATGHAVIALIGSEHELTKGAVQWMLDTQRPDGSWGYYGHPTAEETAYCLQALSAYDRYVEPVDRSALAHGREWLLTCRLEMPALWVGKCLYTPVRVVESAIYSALVMTRPYREPSRKFGPFGKVKEMNRGQYP